MLGTLGRPRFFLDQLLGHASPPCYPYHHTYMVPIATEIAQHILEPSDVLVPFSRKHVFVIPLLGVTLNCLATG